MKRTALVTGTLFLVACEDPTRPAIEEVEVEAVATSRTFYVDDGGNDARSCSTACSSSTPLQTIQAGVLCATQPGDIVEVKSGTFAEVVSRWASGTSDAPILVRVASGQTAIWRSPVKRASADSGAVRIVSRNHIRLEGFRFEGTVTRATIYVRDSRGIEIEGNRFADNGNRSTRAVVIHAVRGHGLRVEDNLFDANAAIDVLLSQTTGAVVAHNEMRGGLATLLASGIYTHRAVHLGSESGGNDVVNNHIHSFRRDVSGTYRTEGIKCDVNGDGNVIADNTIRDLPDGSGIFIESGCDQNVVQGNLIYRVGEASGTNGAGIRVGSPETRTALGNVVRRNTIHEAETGIWLNNAGRTVVTSNIVSATQQAAVVANEKSVAAGGHEFGWNDYWRPGSSLIGRWDEPGARPNLTLADWSRKSGDKTSISRDPLFIDAEDSDFRLRSSSPAIGSGELGANIGAM